jgi:competence protein ComEC
MFQNIIRKNKILFLVVICSIFLFACTDSINTSINHGKDTLKVHFIDVEQADCILIQEGNHTMLIDGGGNKSEDFIVNYIKQQGIQKLDFVIGTHPHEDHIGGLDAVINNFDIGSIWMPKVSHNSQTFLDVLTAIKNKNLKINLPVVGKEIQLTDAKAVILAPNNNTYEGFNNYSIVLKLNYKNTSFLFTGDAESLSEEEMLKNSSDLKSNVLKIAHHGSTSSTTNTFLEAVDPEYAVIQCGYGNSYGHPHRETIEKLDANNIMIYRTDQNGTIIATSDGETIQFDIEKQGSQKETDSNNYSKKDAIYVDKNGRGLIKGNINSKGEKIYHMPDGAYYEKVNPEIWFKTEKEAKSSGFRKSKK